MTLSDIYKIGKEILKNAKIDDYEFDNRIIFEHCFNLKSDYLIIDILFPITNIFHHL